MFCIPAPPGQSQREDARRGMTLVEVMVAIIVFGAFIAGMCEVVMVAKEASDRGRLHYAAINIAKNRLERIKTFGFEQLPRFVETRVVVNVQGQAASAGDYRRTTTVQNVKTNLAQVTVLVDIRNKETAQFSGQSERLITYIARFQSR